LQIRACRSKISESGLGRFLLVLATDFLWSPGGQLNSQEQGKIISGPRRYSSWSCACSIVPENLAVRTMRSCHKGSTHSPCKRLKK
jgi:hypothetical protein